MRGLVFIEAEGLIAHNYTFIDKLLPESFQTTVGISTVWAWMAHTDFFPGWAVANPVPACRRSCSQRCTYFYCSCIIGRKAGRPPLVSVVQATDRRMCVMMMMMMMMM